MSGGGRTWTQGVLEQLRAEGPRAAEWEFVVPADLARSVVEGGAVPARLLTRPVQSTRRRLAWEQVALAQRPGLLVSGGNFGPLVRRQEHVVVAHNALHFQPVTVAGRAGARLHAEGLLARASVRRATATVVATSHMAALVENFTGVEAVVLPFGPGLVKRQQPRPSGGRFVFLHRTSWGPHKRLIDLLLAVRELATSDNDRFVVRSACDPRTEFALGFAESRAERGLLEDPLVAAHVDICELSPNDQRELRGDAVVIPSTTESFCFPIAEAVGFGLPVLAADSPFARELCGGGGMLVPAGDFRMLAAGMRALLHGERPMPPPPQAVIRLSWRDHVDGLAGLCNRLMPRQ